MTSLPESGGAAAGAAGVLLVAFADGSGSALDDAVAAVASFDGAVGGAVDGAVGGAVDGPSVLVGTSAIATRSCADVVMANAATSSAACCASRGADTQAM